MQSNDFATVSNLERIHDQIKLPVLINNIKSVVSGKTGKTYYTVSFYDGEKDYDINVFEFNGNNVFDYAKQHINETSAIKNVTIQLVKSKTDPYCYKIAEIDEIQEIPEDIAGRFRKYSPISPASLENQLNSLLTSCKTPLAKDIIAENHDAFVTGAAASSHHHTFIGGLLMHTTFMAIIAKYLCDLKANPPKAEDLKNYNDLIEFHTTQTKGDGAKLLQKILNFALSLTDKLCTLYQADSNSEELERSKMVTSRAVAIAIHYSCAMQSVASGSITPWELYGLPVYARRGIFSRDKLSDEEFTAIQYCIKHAFAPDEAEGPSMKEAWITRAVVRLMNLGIWKDDVQINPDYLINGISLHDIGKLQEMQTDEFGSATYTIKGNLLGHLYLGVAMVMDHTMKAKDNGTLYDKSTVQNVMHIIASHHCHLEWGALVEPQTIEAKIAFELDMLDSRVEMTREETKDLQHGEFLEKGKSMYYKL